MPKITKIKQANKLRHIETKLLSLSFVSVKLKMLFFFLMNFNFILNFHDIVPPQITFDNNYHQILNHYNTNIFLLKSA